jgi:hypothetical protein
MWYRACGRIWQRNVSNHLAVSFRKREEKCEGLMIFIGFDYGSSKETHLLQSSTAMIHAGDQA